MNKNDTYSTDTAGINVVVVSGSSAVNTSGVVVCHRVGDLYDVIAGNVAGGVVVAAFLAAGVVDI